MMCAHSTPLPAGVPAVQSPSDNILDGAPSVLGAILHCLYTLIALSVGAAFVYVYIVVIRKIWYNRLMGGLE